MNKKAFIPLKKSFEGRARHSLAGFTLLEVVTATLVITVLAAGMFSALVGAQYIFNRARHRIQAFHFAKEAQDRLRSNYRYNSNPQMTVGSDKPESNIGTIIKGEMTDLSTVLTYNVLEPEVNGYKEITVTVNWNETSF